MLALEMGELETLTPIRFRYSGEVIDLSNAYDDQSVMHTEVITLKRGFINTTVGRVILNDHLPPGFAVCERTAQEEGIVPNWCSTAI